jgi:hypothetical protein
MHTQLVNRPLRASLHAELVLGWETSGRQPCGQHEAPIKVSHKPRHPLPKEREPPDFDKMSTADLEM